MIDVKNILVMNLENAIRGMRNPLESWDKSDSYISHTETLEKEFILGENDMKLALRLVKSGMDHSKFMRQIFVSMDITAPLYWWKEYDTYKVSTVANSTSTMHKLGSRNLNDNDFSWDELNDWRREYLNHINSLINNWRNNKTEENFRMIVQDLLDSYNQTRTCTLNYQVLRNIYFARSNHKLQEWKDFCEVISSLPNSELITVEKEK